MLKKFKFIKFVELFNSPIKTQQSQKIIFIDKQIYE